MSKHIHIHLHRTYDAFVASEHPRGQPGNKGQFAKKGEGTVSGGGTSEVASKTASREPAPSPQPAKAKEQPAPQQKEPPKDLAKNFARQKRIHNAEKTYLESKHTPEDRDKALTEISHAVFDYMGLNKNVKFKVDDPYDFKVGDKNFTTGGWYNNDDNEITICTNNSPLNDHLTGLICHEAQHAKFNAIKKAYEDESERIFNDEVHGGKDILKPDGSIRPEYQKEFPIHHATMSGFPIPGNVPVNAFQKDDGITDYSRAYWEAANKGTGDLHTAINETLSEMAKLDNEGSLPNLIWYKKSKTFKPLYNMINKLYPAAAEKLNA